MLPEGEAGGDTDGGSGFPLSGLDARELPPGWYFPIRLPRFFEFGPRVRLALRILGEKPLREQPHLVLDVLYLLHLANNYLAIN